MELLECLVCKNCMDCWYELFRLWGNSKLFMTCELRCMPNLTEGVKMSDDLWAVEPVRLELIPKSLWCWLLFFIMGVEAICNGVVFGSAVSNFWIDSLVALKLEFMDLSS